MERFKSKCKYRVRYFYSKGAVLILVWSLSVGMLLWSLLNELSDGVSLLHSKYRDLTNILPLMGVLAAPIFGWLADAKLGKYCVLKTGLVLIFIGTLANCTNTLIASTVTELVFQVMKTIISVGLIVGFCAYFVTALQLGLDQMPDASASSITSFITCYVVSITIGCLLSAIMHNIIHFCTDQQQIQLSYKQIWFLILSLSSSLTLISDIFLTPKWLIVEPRSAQSLKMIYQVLKFAAKHKSPLNRSAFTYWEEDIPSRIDLGKSKYGGPFTTEQVEDVKTTLQLLLVSLSMCVIMSSGFFCPNIALTSKTELDVCEVNILRLFTYSSLWWIIIVTLFHEFVIFPLARNMLPSILKKIGIVSLVATAISLLCLILKVVEYYTGKSTVPEWIITVIYWAMTGLLTQVLITSMLEFLYAQSPYNMRGLFAGYGTFIATVSGFLGIGTSSTLNYFIKPEPKSDIIGISVKTSLCLAGFVLHCVLAHWYKLRVRDEVYSPQRIVEEVYDRYLTQRNSSLSSSETINLQ